MMVFQQGVFRATDSALASQSAGWETALWPSASSIPLQCQPCELGHVAAACLSSSSCHTTPVSSPPDTLQQSHVTGAKAGSVATDVTGDSTAEGSKKHCSGCKRALLSRHFREHAQLGRWPVCRGCEANERRTMDPSCST